MRRIIDTHLDLAWNALGWDRDLTLPVAKINQRELGMPGKGRGQATTSLPEMRAGGVAVCLATVLARVNPAGRSDDGGTRVNIDFATQEMASAVAWGQLAYYRLLERRGAIAPLRNASDLEAHWDAWHPNGDLSAPIGYILAMEGADPIVDPTYAEDWFHEGLRAVSLSHYGPSRYAMGTGGNGPLTSEGVELLAEFERLGIILDVTHLAEPGFSEALDRFPGPVMASHNNCRALVPGDRQFSNDQIRGLAGRGAVIGVALDAWMLHPDWDIEHTSPEDVKLEAVVDHIDHICQISGNCRHVGIGSDLDGGYGSEQTPDGLDTIADLQKLGNILTHRGYSDADLDAVFHANFLEFFRDHLPE